MPRRVQVRLPQAMPSRYHPLVGTAFVLEDCYYQRNGDGPETVQLAFSYMVPPPCEDGVAGEWVEISLVATVIEATLRNIDPPSNRRPRRPSVQPLARRRESRSRSRRGARAFRRTTTTVMQVELPYDLDEPQ